MVSRALSRNAGRIAFAIAVLLCVAGIFQQGLWTPDEPREAEIGREMLVSHFSAMPTLGEVPFLEKPPLYAWITAAFYAAFGVSAAVARLPAALCSIGAIWVAYLMGRRVAGRLAGLASAVVLATMWQFSETSHKAVLDIALTFFVAAGHLAFLATYGSRIPPSGCKADLPGATAQRSPTAESWNRMSPYIAIGVLSGLAFLTKAWIGPALLCAPPILAAAAMRDWEYVKRVLPRAFVAAVLGVAILGGPWVMALANTPGGGWPAVKECLVTEYVGRSVGGDEFRKQGHANPPWYYLTVTLVIVAPWCLALPAMLKSGALSRTWRGGRALWCGLTFVAGVVLLSVPSGKRDLYLVPMMPVAAVAVGVWLSRVGSRRGGAWDRMTCRAITALAWTVITVIGLGIAYASQGGHLPGSAGDLAPHLDYRHFGCGAIVVGVTCLAAAIWVRRVKGFVPPAPVRTTWALVMLFALLHAAVRPLLDPPRDLSAGARQIASLVPENERFVALDADETTLAFVPFYSGRILENFETADEALAALGSGATKYLVVMDKDIRKLTPALKRRLELVKTVEITATREVNVYALKP